MHFDTLAGVLTLKETLVLGPNITKKELFSSDYIIWEGWPEKKDDNTVSYRTILKGDKKFGDLYLIINFLRPNDPDSELSSWRFSPEKLLMGEQKKPEGNVTRGLRGWFKERSTISLPVSGSWGHVDAAYDPHNRTGTIVCNYRQGFKDDKKWDDYCKWNNLNKDDPV